MQSRLKRLVAEQQRVNEELTQLQQDAESLTEEELAEVVALLGRHDQPAEFQTLQTCLQLRDSLWNLA